MKVICIKQGRWLGINTSIIFDGPKYGERCSVTGEGVAVDGTLVYFLSEWPEEGGWAQIRFIPLSEIDETEMIRNYDTEKV
jgi:hypothetical protein